MQFVPALFAGISSAGTAVTAATGLSAASILSGAATIGGVLSTVGASNAQSQSYKAEAAQVGLESDAADTASLQKNTAMKRELLRVLGENSVTAAAAGIDVGSGVAAESANLAKSTAATEISIDRSAQDARRAMMRARAAGLRGMASNAKRAGAFSAFGQLAQGGIDIANRGGAASGGIY
jgi:hypothetical protein